MTNTGFILLWFNWKMLEQNSSMSGMWPVVLWQRSLTLSNSKIKKKVWKIFFL